MRHTVSVTDSASLAGISGLHKQAFNLRLVTLLLLLLLCRAITRTSHPLGWPPQQVCMQAAKPVARLVVTLFLACQFYQCACHWSASLACH